MKDRTYLRRNRRIQITEYDDLVAVQAPELSSNARLAPGTAVDRGAFDRAGWRFMRAEDSGLAGQAPRAKVFMAGERLLLATGRVVAKFKDDLPMARVDAILDRLDLVVVTRLTFAPHLYELAPRSNAELRDALTLAEELASLEDCDFAEPSFTEAIGARPRPAQAG